MSAIVRVFFVEAVGKCVIFRNVFVIGYLRLKRRYRILCIIRDLKTAKAYIQPSNKVQLQKLQSVSISRPHMHTHACAENQRCMWLLLMISNC